VFLKTVTPRKRKRKKEEEKTNKMSSDMPSVPDPKISGLKTKKTPIKNIIIIILVVVIVKCNNNNNNNNNDDEINFPPVSTCFSCRTTV